MGRPGSLQSAYSASEVPRILSRGVLLVSRCCSVQVNVRALKDLLWDSLVAANTQKASHGSSDSTDADSEDEQAHHGSTAATAGAEAAVPFQEVIVSVPEQSAAGSLEDVSVHMCFICLLHLANERGLVITANEDLKTLSISNLN